MTWLPTNWKPPHTGDTPLRVKFRNGETSKDALPAEKWKWKNRDHDYDIVAWRPE